MIKNLLEIAYIQKYWNLLKHNKSTKKRWFAKSFKEGASYTSMGKLMPLTSCSEPRLSVAPQWKWNWLATNVPGRPPPLISLLSPFRPTFTGDVDKMWIIYMYMCNEILQNLISTIVKLFIYWRHIVHLLTPWTRRLIVHLLTSHCSFTDTMKKTLHCLFNDVTLFIY